MWRSGGRSNMSVAAPHMGVIRSRGFVPSFSPFVSDPKSEPSVIRPGLPVLVSTSHTVAARRRSYQYPAYGRAGAQEDETNLSFGLSRPEGRGGRPLGSDDMPCRACSSKDINAGSPASGKKPMPGPASWLAYGL